MVFGNAWVQLIILITFFVLSFGLFILAKPNG